MGLSFPFPFLDVFIVPTDASATEPRIEIDGLTGEIRVYNSAGDLFASITPSDGVQVFDPTTPGEFIRIDETGGLPTLSVSTGDADEDVPGRLIGVITGAGGTRNATIDIASGTLSGGDRGRLVLQSESQDGTEPSRFRIDARELAVPAAMVEATAGPVGAVVGRIAVYNGAAASTVIGYIPVYDTI